MTDPIDTIRHVIERMRRDGRGSPSTTSVYMGKSLYDYVQQESIAFVTGERRTHPTDVMFSSESFPRYDPETYETSDVLSLDGYSCYYDRTIPDWRLVVFDASVLSGEHAESMVLHAAAGVREVTFRVDPPEEGEDLLCSNCDTTIDPDDPWIDGTGDAEYCSIDCLNAEVA